MTMRRFAARPIDLAAEEQRPLPMTYDALLDEIARCEARLASDATASVADRISARLRLKRLVAARDAWDACAMRAPATRADHAHTLAEVEAC